MRTSRPSSGSIGRSATGSSRRWSRTDFLSRGSDGQLRLGAGVLTLASRFEPQLRSAARPLLYELVQETGAAAFISVPQGEDCVAIMVAEPEEGVLRVAYRIGSRHPLTTGAAGIAILAGRRERASEPEGVREARLNGFSVTRSQLQQGAVGVASPVHGFSREPIGFEASVGVVALDDLDVSRATGAVVACARRLATVICSHSQAMTFQNDDVNLQMSEVFKPNARPILI